MRKFFTIALLFAYLFNLVGYTLFFQYSINQADERIIQQLDKNRYSDSEFVEVKIKLNLPYMSDWSGYERYDGEVEFQGVHYNYAKRKISRDTLYMLCVPNESKTELYKGRNKYLVSVNDIPSGKENNSSAANRNISLGEYEHEVMSYDFAIDAIQGRPEDCSYSLPVPRFFMETPGKPPEINS